MDSYTEISLNDISFNLKYEISDGIENPKVISTEHKIDFYVLSEDGTYVKTTESLSVGSILDKLFWFLP